MAGKSQFSIKITKSHGSGTMTSCLISRQPVDNMNTYGLVLALLYFLVGVHGLQNEAEKRQKLYLKHGFDAYFSNKKIGLKRQLPDFRSDHCKSMTYNHLKPVSIIICFHNEAWSTLIRSLHSIFDQTPNHLLTEVILVDDHSNLSHLKTKLDRYLSNKFKNGKIQMIRLKQRHGLIKARMIGIENVSKSSDILVFLDSHVEVTQGWLEPLIDAILKDPKLVVCPIIDAIHMDTFEYIAVNQTTIGYFDWSLDFHWKFLQWQDEPSLIDMPAMSGGLFAINKDFFEHLGHYDPGLKIWGSENLELSFKTWMCGGKIQLNSCSRVGHVFRKFSNRIEAQSIYCNKVRVAQVWMDDYQHLFYHKKGPKDELLQTCLKMTKSQLKSRHDLRAKLKCQDFHWYMENVLKPSGLLPVYDIQGAGEVRNLGLENMCLNAGLSLSPCHGHGLDQYWILTQSGALINEDNCLELESKSLKLKTNCTSKWSYNTSDSQFKTTENTCLQFNLERLELSACNSMDPFQKWSLSTFSQSGLQYKDLVY